MIRKFSQVIDNLTFFCRHDYCNRIGKIERLPQPRWRGLGRMITPYDGAGTVRSLSIALTVVGLLGWHNAAHATNLVSDPNFTGSPLPPAGWTLGTGANVIADPTAPDNLSPGITTDLALGTGSASATLTGLVPGATYTITFDLAADKTTINNAQDSVLNGDGTSGDATVTVGLGSDTLGTVDAIANYVGAIQDVYQAQTGFSDTANATSEILNFSGVNTNTPAATNPLDGYTYNDGTWYLTNVDVECTGNCGVTAVPEPPAILVLASALCMLFGLAGAYRRFSR